MAKKLSEIRAEIAKGELIFHDYLKSNLEHEVFNFIEELGSRTKVFLFSGIIRNFFLDRNEIRDVDLVVTSDVNLSPLISTYPHRLNSFGGYKIQIGHTNVDLWSVEKTWAFTHQSALNLDLDKVLHTTAFFNFSSIVYSFESRKFEYTNHFLRFLRDRKINVVFEPNANTELCVVNTFYYADKYHLKIDKKLKKVVKNFHLKSAKDYQPTQLKHFGKIIYSNYEIENRVQSLGNS